MMKLLKRDGSKVSGTSAFSFLEVWLHWNQLWFTVSLLMSVGY